MPTLEAQTRKPGQRLEKLREEGKLPAVFYGAGQKSTPILVDEGAFQKVWKEAGESTAIKLATAEGDIDALIQDVQIDPIVSKPIHADFLVVDMNKPVQTFVPLEFTGEAPAIKNGLGTLVKVMHEIEVEAKPKDLPPEIQVDVSGLKTLEDQITVKDVTIPPAVTSITKEGDVVAMISPIREEEEEKIAPEADLSQIEVEKKGKEEAAESEEESAQGEKTETETKK